MSKSGGRPCAGPTMTGEQPGQGGFWNGHTGSCCLPDDGPSWSGPGPAGLGLGLDRKHCRVSRRGTLTGGNMLPSFCTHLQAR